MSEEKLDELQKKAQAYEHALFTCEFLIDLLMSQPITHKNAMLVDHALAFVRCQLKLLREGGIENFNYDPTM